MKPKASMTIVKEPGLPMRFTVRAVTNTLEHFPGDEISPGKVGSLVSRGVTIKIVKDRARMKTTCSYPVSFEAATLALPVDAKCVHFATQCGRYQGRYHAWFEIETTAACVSRFFRIFVAGSLIPDGAKHCGTMSEGDFVFHLYEVGAL